MGSTFLCECQLGSSFAEKKAAFEFVHIFRELLCVRLCEFQSFFLSCSDYSYNRRDKNFSKRIREEDKKKQKEGEKAEYLKQLEEERKRKDEERFENERSKKEK